MGIRGERGRGDWARGGCRMGRGSIIILFLTKVYPCSSRTLRLIYLYVGTGKSVFTKLLLKPVLCLSKPPGTIYVYQKLGWDNHSIIFGWEYRSIFDNDNKSSFALHIYHIG